MHGTVVYVYTSEWLYIHLNLYAYTSEWFHGFRYYILQELDHKSFNMDSEWFHGFRYFTSKILLIFYKRKKSWIMNHLIYGYLDAREQLRHDVDETKIPPHGS